MSKNLQEILNLPEVGQSGAPAQWKEFSQGFRQGMARLNQELQVVVGQASRTKSLPLESQRTKLYDAYQQAIKQLDSTDKSQAQQTTKRILKAVSKVAEQASAVASEATSYRDQWGQKEGDYDDAMQQVSMLEENGHTKASAFRKLGEAIRQQVNNRKYEESLKTFSQMLPKLEGIFSELETSEGDNQADQDRDELWQELESIEAHLKLLITEHQIEV